MKSDARVIKGEAMKTQIYNVAIEIIVKEGLYGLSAKKIADQLNISKSNVFHHFSSIERLKEVLLDQVIAQLLTWDDVPISPDLSLDGFLGFLIEQTLGVSEGEKAMYSTLLQFHTACLYEPLYKDKFIAAKNNAVMTLSQALCLYSNSSEMKCLEIANAMVMVLDGFGLHYLLEENDDSIKAIWSKLCIHWKNQLINGG